MVFVKIECFCNHGETVGFAYGRGETENDAAEAARPLPSSVMSTVTTVIHPSRAKSNGFYAKKAY